MRVALLAVSLLLSLNAPAAVPDPRDAVLERMATLLEQRYVDEAKGKALAGMLRDAARADRFDALSEPDAFAKAVQAALRETVPDKHLQVSFEPDAEFVPGAGADQRVVRKDAGGARMVVRTGRMDARSVEAIAKTNFGVDRVEHLDGNIGYVALSRFVPTDLSRDTLRAAIGLVAHSDAVVIDLRGNIGGSPDAVGLLASPFFAAERGPVALHAADNRALGIHDVVATDPAQSVAQLADVPLYVLVSARTASAAEMFAFALKRLGRATIVGETTSGAGNGGAKQSVGEGFALVVPEWANTLGTWERVGVRPD
ncbi:MAG TPA: S41 family peptidase, partial [Xanthomonadales bacterium]|nr:S41 family peptidase [Xanthomonadales bacterium]